MIKKAVWGIAIAAVGFFGWKMFFIKPEVATEAKLAGSVQEVPPGLEHKVLSFSIDGRSPKGVKQWHLEGNSAEIVEDDIHLRDLKAIAYSEEATINLVSEKGIYRKAKGEVELIGNVLVTTDKGVELTTERAKWSQHTKEISSDAIVHITGEGMKAVGKGAMANADEQIAMLLQDVMVLMEPGTQVNSDGKLVVDFKGNKAVFNDNVLVEDKDGKLIADKLTVEMAPGSKQIVQVIAEGNVKLKRGKSYTISDKAVYTDSTKHAELSGRPRIVIDPSELAELEKTKL